METIVENILLVKDGLLLPGFIFGIVHVSLVLIGFYTGWSLSLIHI